MSNHLKNEKSPYLLQHKDNPVNWYPWCSEAFEKAKNENKPVFLSIGYSTCHWCHVMARESFENESIAEILNRAFVSIKVDREERPDIDSVYMSVCQVFTGNGGWPTSIFMTWDKKPFFAGTYFPPETKGRIPGFLELITVIEKEWQNNRKALISSAEKIIAHLNTPSRGGKREDDEMIPNAILWFYKAYDNEFGGFGPPPKFPTPHSLLFLMLYSKLEQDKNTLKMAEKTLEQMRKGGIYDQIDGGFSRYSTDRLFLVPHFEKMLYDNAWLIIAYSAAYIITGKDFYIEAAKDTADFILRDMTSSAGAFYSALDADSEGQEGKYYTFTLKEVEDVLGLEKARKFAEAFDITEKGNFDGKNIPNLLKSGNLYGDYSEEKRLLSSYRKDRVKLHTDDKTLCAWNGMMIGAMCILYRACKENKYLDAAERAQKFIDDNLYENGRLYTSFRDGKRSDVGFLDDYAYEIAALIELYHSTFKTEYLEKAQSLCHTVIDKFYDKNTGGFYLSESSELFLNPKETYDGAVPSGNGMMAYSLVRLYQITNDVKYKTYCDRQMEFLSAQAGNYPAGHSMYLIAKLLYDRPLKHITFVYNAPCQIEKLKEKVPFFANIVVTAPKDDFKIINDKPTVYVCDEYVCRPPSNSLEFK